MSYPNVEFQKHREAMQVIRGAIRAAPDGSRRLGDLLTQEQIERLSVGMDGIQTDDDYRMALKAISAILGARPAQDSVDAEHLQAHISLVQAYEAKHYARSWSVSPPAAAHPRRFASASSRA